MSLNPLSSDYWQPRKGQPRLFLAPMEGLNDRPWRRAYSQVIAGFDETCCEFIRMPITGHAASLAKSYDPNDTFPLPIAAQIMGEKSDTCAHIAFEIEKRGAFRVDLNCGCPSNIVVGKGAGSSLLQTPDLIYDIASAMKRACSKAYITVKMRAGYQDTSLFAENLLAAQEAGASFITLHPRTRVQGYSGRADWSLIAKAKEIVRVPIVASGDVTTIERAHELFTSTGCDGIMIGRGAFIDPWIFWKIRSHFQKEPFLLNKEKECELLEKLLCTFLSESSMMSPAGQVGRLKQVIRFLAQKQEGLQETLKPLFLYKGDPQALINHLISFWRNHVQDSSIRC